MATKKAAAKKPAAKKPSVTASAGKTDASSQRQVLAGRKAELLGDSA